MEVQTIFVLLTICAVSYGSRILSINPMPSRSHGILFERLLGELSAKGHEITYVTGVPLSKSIPNVKEIEVLGVRDALNAIFLKPGNNETVSLLSVRTMNPWFMMMFSWKFPSILGDHVLGYPAVQQLLNSEEKFDLIYGEIMMNEAILAGLSSKFQAPIVAFAPFMPNHFANYLVGNPAPASFIPDTFLGYDTRMTFLERVHNFLFGLGMELTHSLINLPIQDKMLRKYFGTEMPYIADIIRNTSLVLVNHHYSLGYPKPYNPNMIEVGGMHINPPKALPKDLKKIMDNAKNGVILFSLGSNVNSSDLPRETISSILKGFAKLDQDVLWKFETELTGLPKNVRIMKWLPQSDILAHPNLKLFITHGGLLSTTESLARGVPVLGVPLMGDQHANMKLTEISGWGRSINLDDINEDTLYNEIQELLNNPRYKKTAVEKSILYNDIPMPPMETAIWWIEYVIRHKGAAHLRSAAQDLKWYELYLLDVYALAAAVIIPILLLNICITRAIFRRIFCRNCSKDKTKEQKKKTKKEN